MINCDLQENDIPVVVAIAKRAVALSEKHGVKIDFVDTQMDIAATHLNGNPLNLQGLLKADDFNFALDIAGIGQHINRETGELENCFLPRFSA